MLILVYYLLLLYIQVNDALLYQHGTDYNEMFGGTCKQFKMLNNLQTCCPERDDNCYMIHFDTRCYCDTFCHLYNTTDCCPDSSSSCSSESVTLNSIINDNECNENDFYMKDCNKCQKNCSTGLFECSENECLIDTDLLNEINNDKKSSWTAFNYPEFESKYLSYGYIHKLGTRLDESRKLRKTFNYDYDSSMIQPIDYRQLIKDNNNHLNENNECGISWALSTLDVVYDRIALLKNNNFDTLPSIDHLLNCLNKSQNSKCTQTNGTGVHTAWHLLEHKMLDNGTTKHGGILNNQCYDYLRKTNKFINICNVNDLKKYKCNDLTRPKLFRASSVKLLDSRKIKNIMKEIQTNGPVQMVFKVYSDFFMYKSGIYTKSKNAKLPSNVPLYHAVKVVGWNKSAEGIPFWIAKNYFGSDWGENGYFRIRMDDVHTEIGMYVYVASVTYQ